jgi:hypothetical protein
MANRFGRFWAKGKMLIARMRTMQQRGVFVLLRRHVILVGGIGLMLCSIVLIFMRKM